MSPDSIGTITSIGEAIVRILTPVITILGGIAMAHLTAWIKSKTHNSVVEGAMTILRDLVTTTVQELEQTTVKALRDNDGRLDAKTAAEIKAAAVRKLQMLYGPEGLKNLAKRLGTSEDATLQLIGSLIEQAVYLLKSQSSSPPPVAQPFDLAVFGGMTEEEKRQQAAASQAPAVQGAL